METEEIKSHGKEETVRHWDDKEVKDIHKRQGKSWRSNNDKHETLLPVSNVYRANYDSIFRKKK
jgi:hypothetical protein